MHEAAATVLRETRRLDRAVAAEACGVRREGSAVAGRDADGMANTALVIRMLVKRLEPDVPLRDVEAWWPLALRIGAAVDADAQASEAEKQAARGVVWAVSGAIRACKRDGHPGHHACRTALATLMRTMRRRRTPAGTPRPSVMEPGDAAAG